MSTNGSVEFKSYCLTSPCFANLLKFTLTPSLCPSSHYVSFASKPNERPYWGSPWEIIGLAVKDNVEIDAAGIFMTKNKLPMRLPK